MKICTATVAKSNAAMAATSLSQEGMTFGALTRVREAAHKTNPGSK